jgi:Mg-chelatase subunit ChlD
MPADGHHKAGIHRAIPHRDSRATTGSSLRKAAIHRKQVDTDLRVRTALRPDIHPRGIHPECLAVTHRSGRVTAAFHRRRRAQP